MRVRPSRAMGQTVPFLTPVARMVLTRFFGITLQLGRGEAELATRPHNTHYHLSLGIAACRSIVEQCTQNCEAPGS